MSSFASFAGFGGLGVSSLLVLLRQRTSTSYDRLEITVIQPRKGFFGEIVLFGL